MIYEQQLVEGTDNCFNCPVVGTYPEVIRNNMESVQDSDVRLISPFLNLGNREFLPKRIAEVFADWNVTEAEANAALDAAWEEDAAVKAEIREKGREALAGFVKTGCAGLCWLDDPITWIRKSITGFRS
mgnify:CR=1 FL=1